MALAQQRPEATSWIGSLQPMAGLVAVAHGSRDLVCDGVTVRCASRRVAVAVVQYAALNAEGHPAFIRRTERSWLILCRIAVLHNS